MNKEKKSFTTIISICCILLASSLMIFQIGYFLLARRLGFHFIDHRVFFFLNCLLLLFATIFYSYYTQNKKRLIVLFLFIVGLQIIGSIFFTSSKAIITVSPNQENIFIVHKNKKTGNASYDRSIYYEFPSLAQYLSLPKTKNGYWLLSRPIEFFPYPMSNTFHTNWINNDVCVLTYTTPDGSLQQFARGYNNFQEQSSEQIYPLAIIGDWSNSKDYLHAKGATYELTLSGEKYELNPLYSHIYGENLITFHDQLGNAICTIVLFEKEKKMTIVPAEKKETHIHTLHYQE